MKTTGHLAFPLKLGVLLSFLAAAATALAAPGIISATASAGCKAPMRVGEQITVTLHMDAYSDAVEIDGFNLTVSYDTNLFAFVDGSFSLEDISGEPQWLSLPGQESPANGYRPTAIISGATPGKLAISVSDLGYTSAESGATADSGFLASFNLQAIGEGTGTVTLEPFAGGSVLFDTSLSPAGVPQLLGEKKIKIKRSR